MIKAICLDMDDTLIVNQILYGNAEHMLAGYMTHFGVTPEETLAAFAEIDKDNYKTMGISIARMPLSFEHTLLRFVPDADAAMVARARDFAERIFRTVADVKPDIAEALELLSKVAPLHIVTGGADSVQQFRIDHLPFKDKFNSFTIIPKKDAAVYTNVAQKLNLNPSEIIMIGDSLRSDVLPAVEAGMRAVWVETLNSPLHEIKKVDLPAGAYKFASLLELGRHLAQHGDLDVKAPANANKPGAKTSARKAFGGPRS